MHNEVKNKRDLYFDYLKGILILLVLLGHAIQYGNGHPYYSEGSYWNNGAMKAIYSFHMPLFAAISGYFQFFSMQKETSFTSYIRRCSRISIPAVVWSLIVVICKAVTGGDILFLKSLLYAVVCNYWFIWAVLIGTGLIYAIAWIKKRATRLCVYAVVFTVFLLTPDLLWVGAAVKYVVLFCFIGYELARAGWHPRCITNRGMWLGVGLWLLLLLFYNKDSYIYTSLYSVVQAANPLKQFSIDVFRSVIGMAGSFSLCSLGHWVWIRTKEGNGWLNRFLLSIGKHSLAVYILSTPLYMYLVPDVTFAFSPAVLSTLVVTAVVTLCCMVTTALLGKNKWISVILLGE